MKKAKLPLPILVLMSAALFLVSSSFGEWIGRPSSASPISAGETVEGQQSAIVYLRVISWLSQVITHPPTLPEADSESAPQVKLINMRPHGVSPRAVQLCALRKLSHFSTNLRRSTHCIVLHPQSSVTLLAAPRAADFLRDSGAPAGGS